jgi:hypothetical protein
VPESQTCHHGLFVKSIRMPVGSTGSAFDPPTVSVFTLYLDPEPHGPHSISKLDTVPHPHKVDADPKH